MAPPYNHNPQIPNIRCSGRRSESAREPVPSTRRRARRCGCGPQTRRRERGREATSWRSRPGPLSAERVPERGEETQFVGALHEQTHAPQTPRLSGNIMSPKPPQQQSGASSRAKPSRTDVAVATRRDKVTSHGQATGYSSDSASRVTEGDRILQVYLGGWAAAVGNTASPRIPGPPTPCTRCGAPCRTPS